jgi:predicted ATPase
MLFSRSHGNPFVVIDYLRASVDQGNLSYRNREWYLDKDAIEKLSLSDSAFGLISQRLDNLSGEVKSYLQLASLNGTTFHVEDITIVAGIDFSLQRMILKQAELAGIILQISSERWQFIHDKIVEILLQSMSRKLEQELAGRLASYFDQKVNASEEEQFTSARLYQRGHSDRNAQAAVLANIKAAQISLDRFAYNEAYGFLKFSSSAIISYQLPKALEIQVAPTLATCANFLGYWDEAIN